MSNTPAPRTAETTTNEWSRDHTITTKYETDYRFAKREFGGWLIYLTNPNAIRTVETDSIVEPVSKTAGLIGWVTKNHEQGWDLWHPVAGNLKAEGLGRGYATREEAVESLTYELLSRSTVSPASPERFRYLARDFVDHNELVLTASRTVERFGWEDDYDALIARIETRKTEESK